MNLAWLLVFAQAGDSDTDGTTKSVQAIENSMAEMWKLLMDGVDAVTDIHRSHPL